MAFYYLTKGKTGDQSTGDPNAQHISKPHIFILTPFLLIVPRKIANL